MFLKLAEENADDRFRFDSLGAENHPKHRLLNESAIHHFHSARKTGSQDATFSQIGDLA